MPEGLIDTFFIAKKVTMLRRAARHLVLQLSNRLAPQKTRLGIGSFALCPGMLSRLLVFHAFLFYGFMAIKKGIRSARTILRRKVLLPEEILFEIPQAPSGRT